MRRSHKVLEYRLVIPGRAKSFRSPSAKQYKHKIRQLADFIFKRPLKWAIEIKMDYFHNQNRRMDMDNIAKCIMDALSGVAYPDDKVVRLQKSMSHDLRNHIQIWDTIDIIKPLDKYEEYIFVRIRNIKT